ncbi:metal-dependent hydrolase [Heliorestis acidaminivorans]|uniref:Metal-dependent hydrolase n=1 Tax=Heliorestis acidaminivorans TaxID=553427 RepID=A0A6I0ERF7_9FIRM|nr:metal-dependent hydrolase [Heliorestis acidaminivorans]KAB2952136.1 metal-dependent hydrolase [Heliorestis acidaminivorans]
MLWKTHALAGASLGVFLSNHLDTASPMPSLVGITVEPYVILTIGAMAGALGSLLPDIDQPNSKVGSKFFMLPTLLKVTIGHRGPTHSIVGAVTVSFLVWLLLSMIYPLTNMALYVLLLAGYISHLVLDSLNPQGVAWLWPVTSKKFRIPMFDTGGVGESLIVIPSLVVLLILVMVL